MEQPIVNVVATGTTRDYDAQYKIKVLKANIPFDEQVTDENTKYIIRWNFNLGGEEVYLPNNCILQFEGGGLSNGTIIGNDTTVIGENRCLKQVTINGTYKNNIVYSSWCYSNGENNLEKIQNGLNLCVGTNSSSFIVDDGDYNINCDIEDSGITVYGNTNVDFNGSKISVIPTDNPRYSLIKLDGDNIKISNGFLIGDVEEHSGDEGEWGFGIHVNGNKNVIVDNISAKYFWGDGMYISSKMIEENQEVPSESTLLVPQNIQINDCEFSNNRRQGLSVISCVGLRIVDSTFNYIGRPEKANPGAGIDFEQNWYNEEIIDDVYIEGCEMLFGSKGIVINDKLGMDINRTFNITVVNCLIGGTCQFRTKEESNIKLIRCDFDGYIELTDGNINFIDCNFYQQLAYMTLSSALERDSVFNFDRCNIEMKKIYTGRRFIRVNNGNMLGSKSFNFINTVFSVPKDSANLDYAWEIIDKTLTGALAHISIDYNNCSFLSTNTNNISDFSWSILTTNSIKNCFASKIKELVLYRKSDTSRIQVTGNDIDFCKQETTNTDPYFLLAGNSEGESGKRSIIIARNNLRFDNQDTPLWNNPGSTTKITIAFGRNISSNNIINDYTRDEFGYIKTDIDERTNVYDNFRILSNVSQATAGNKGNLVINNTEKNLLINVGGEWRNALGYTSWLRYGTTSKRPSSLTTTDYGYPFYDRSLHKPIHWSDNEDWRENDGVKAGVKRSGAWSDKPTVATDIFTGFVYMIKESQNHFPVFANISGSTITWYKADGTEYTGE